MLLIVLGLILMRLSTKQCLRMKDYVSQIHFLVPWMVASNHTNFGKPIKLNCAEALAACLNLAGFKDEAL